MGHHLRRLRVWLVIGAAAAALAAAVAITGSDPPRTHLVSAGLPSPTEGSDCSVRYVSAGDGVVKGTDNSGTSYANKLLEDKLQKVPGPWCLFNTSADPTTTGTYVSDGQQGLAWDLTPRLITLTLGRQNNVVVDHVKDCLQDIKDHQFIQANTCALAVMADSGAWETLHDNLSDILNQYKVQQDGNPQLIVAVTGYFNPYPSATDVATKIPEFCADLVDTIPTCLARWLLLPPALVTLDQVVKKLNSTIADVVAQFTEASQGRFQFVNPYDAFKDHCTKMDVSIKTTVYHPTNTIDHHDSEKDFGCSSPWVASDGDDGTLTPFPYLSPAFDGVLILATQTTSGMGINPNTTGHTCISDLIWEAVKQRLGVAEAPVSDPCSSL